MKDFGSFFNLGLGVAVTMGNDGLMGGGWGLKQGEL